MSGVRRRYELDPGSGISGYFAGAFTGAAMTAFMLTIGMSTAPGDAPDFAWRLAEIAFIAGFAFPMAAIIWSIGGLLALPLWFILHRVGLVGPWAAALSGIALVTIAFLTLADVFGVLNAIVMGAVSGAAAGLALWRVAYRRADCGASVS